MNPPKYSKLPTRFWDKVEVDESGCWLWTAATTRQYGSFRLNGKVRYAHVLSYEDYIGFPAKNFTLHSCDVRACARPSHLYHGTHRENMSDMTRRGRSLTGESNTNAVLTESDVIEARRIRSETGMNYADIALKFGVSRQTITKAIQVETWRHIL